MLALACIGTFALAAVADWLSIVYHDQREQRNVGAVMVVCAVLTVLSWLPVVLAFGLMDEPWAVMGADVAGSAVGAGLALQRIRANEQAKEQG